MSQVSENSTIIKKPKLLDQVRDAIRTKHYSLKTEEAYMLLIRRSSLFRKAWELAYGYVQALGLARRMVD